MWCGVAAGLVFSLRWLARRWRGAGFFFWSNGFALRAGQRQGGVFRIPPPYLWTPLSPQRVKGCSPLTIPKMRSKPKNASRFAKRIFCASPIYGSAEDFTFLLNFTPCEGVTPAAKQQIGETRKKCNSDDRRLRRKQGGAVGAAVSRTRVPLKARSGRWVPQPVASSASKSLALF